MNRMFNIIVFAIAILYMIIGIQTHNHTMSFKSCFQTSQAQELQMINQLTNQQEEIMVSLI